VGGFRCRILRLYSSSKGESGRGGPRRWNGSLTCVSHQPAFCRPAVGNFHGIGPQSVFSGPIVLAVEWPFMAARRYMFVLARPSREQRLSFPSDPPSEEGSPGAVRSRCPTPAVFWPASLATGPAGLPQRGQPDASQAGEAGHASLGTFLSCNKKVSRLPGRDPARTWKRSEKVGAGDTATKRVCCWIPAFAGMTEYQ
jgi:hypothetical protein